MRGGQLQIDARLYTGRAMRRMGQFEDKRIVTWNGLLSFLIQPCSLFLSDVTLTSLDVNTLTSERILFRKQ